MGPGPSGTGADQASKERAERARRWASRRSAERTGKSGLSVIEEEVEDGLDDMLGDESEDMVDGYVKGTSLDKASCSETPDNKRDSNGE